MREQESKIFQFWQELKRRNVIRRNTVYAATAFVILELVSIIEDPLKLPEWTLPLVIVLLSIGFIVSLILSWNYDFSPEGELKKIKPAQKTKNQDKPVVSSKWKIATYLSFVVIVVLFVLNFFPRNHRSVSDTELIKSIAVLPFENMSADSEFAHIGDAMTDEIIMQLYKIHDIEVRSRTSIMQYKNTEKSIPYIGQELKVNYLLEGSAQRQEDQVRIRVQLIHAATDDHIWGEVFDGKWENIFEIQINVAKQVARELKTILSPEEVEKIEQTPTRNPEAYNLYLLGREFAYRGGEGDLDQSIDYYKKALEIDPDYALVYAGMAHTYAFYSHLGFRTRRDAMPLAKEFAMKALEMDNTLAEAHVELATIIIYYDWNWRDGEKAIKRALELNPNYGRAHEQYARMLLQVGRFDEAIQESKRAHELDPLSQGSWSTLARAYYYSRDYDRSIEEFRQILKAFPEGTYGAFWLSVVLVQKGMYDEALKVLPEIGLRSSSFPWQFGYTLAAAGEREKVLEILDLLLERSNEEFVPPINIAFIYIGLGEIDKAFEWLEITYEQREAWLDNLRSGPMFDNLRSDPRYQDLVDRMNFPDS